MATSGICYARTWTGVTAVLSSPILTNYSLHSCNRKGWAFLGITALLRAGSQNTDHATADFQAAHQQKKGGTSKVMETYWQLIKGKLLPFLGQPTAALDCSGVDKKVV
jgi:hypothetical protein